MTLAPFPPGATLLSRFRGLALRMPIVVAIVLLPLLTGCNTLGSVQERAEGVNKTTAGYAASAILFNILRAKEAEPLNFVSLAGVTGHITAGASLGLPTVVVGPGRTPAQNLFLFGPNTISGSEGSDFAVNVVDDPASFAALARPTDPATIGFFINQLSNRDLLLFLLISKFDIVDKNGERVGCRGDDHACKSLENICNDLYRKGRTFGPNAKAVEESCKTKQEYFNEPFTFDTDKNIFTLDSDFVAGFFAKLLGYIQSGLTVSVDQGYVPQAGNAASATFCFDPYRFDNSPSLGSGVGNICPSPDKRSPQALPPAATPGTKGKVVKQQPSSAAQEPEASKPDWSFDDPDRNNKGGKVHVYTRSVFGMYRYLGEILRLRELNALGPLAYPGGIFTDSPQTEMLHLTHGTAGCWASVVYEGVQWCVPFDAIGTKRTFALLHELFELYATPSNQQVTPTVRVTQ
jgi:hypothetical protein